MKHFPILFALLLIICIGSIAGLLFIIAKDPMVEKPTTATLQISDVTTIKVPEISNEELEGEGATYDPSQIYFMDIEPLYAIFSFDDMEWIKFKITTFVHSTIDPSILDIRIIKDSIISSEAKTNFQIQLETGENLEISIISGEPPQIIISGISTNK